MRVRDIMTPAPACCSPEDSLESIARLMIINDCGSIPVCEPGGASRIIGILTDRDIVIRAVAAGRNPLKLKVSDVMSHPVASIDADTDLVAAIQALEENQVRRLPVIDPQGNLIGMLSQADIARNSSATQSGHLVQTVSQGISLGLL